MSTNWISLKFCKPTYFRRIPLFPVCYINMISTKLPSFMFRCFRTISIIGFPLFISYPFVHEYPYLLILFSGQLVDNIVTSLGSFIIGHLVVSSSHNKAVS